MIKSIFHVNINVKDFDRSLAFYQMLGFKVAFNVGEGGNQAFEEGLRIPNNRGKAALLILGDDPRATRIDLIEWKVPKTEGEPYPHLWHAGVARVRVSHQGHRPGIRAPERRRESSSSPACKP